MSFYISDNKEAWLAYRAKYLTSSGIYRLLGEPKKKGEVLTQAAQKYILERLAESLAPCEPDYYSAAMEHGNTTEPQAALRVAKEFGYDVNSDDFLYTSTGGHIFFYNDKYMVGGTPDILLRDKKICVEIKCPDSSTHLLYLTIKNGEDLLKISPQYYTQLQLNCFLTESTSGLFVSFDDRFYDEKLHYHGVTIPYNEGYVNAILDKAKLAVDFRTNFLLSLNK